MDTQSITSTLGVGSGLDIPALVTSLVEAQFAAKNKQLTVKSDALTAQISGVASLKSGITGFSSALASLVKGGSLSTAPTSSNAALIKATALPGAKIANLSTALEVRQLASAQVATSSIVADRTAAIGTGSFTLTFGAATVADGAITGFTAGAKPPLTIAIGAGNASLDGIAAAINAAGAGITATVLTDADGARLSLKGATGAAQGFTLTATEDDGAPGLAALNVGPNATATSVGTVAQDAIVAIDGVALRRPGNRIEDLVPGVRVDLIGAAVGTTIALGSTAPTIALSQAVNDFVETFNQLNAIVKEETNAVSGSLRRDPAAAQLARSLNQLTLTPLVGSAAAGEPKTLAEIGVRTNRDGTLAVDAAQLTLALARFPGAVEALFADGVGASGNGLSGALKTLADRAISTASGLGASEVRYTKAKTGLSTDQAKITDATATLQARLTKQFAGADARIGAYKTSMEFLTQQVDAWNSQK